MPWSVLNGERAPGDRWTSRDRDLAVALVQLEGAICSGCGQPAWLGHDEETDWFEPESVKCYSCEALTAAQDSFAKEASETSSASTLKASTKWFIREATPEAVAAAQAEATRE